MKNEQKSKNSLYLYETDYCIDWTVKTDKKVEQNISSALQFETVAPFSQKSITPNSSITCHITIPMHS